MTILARYTPGRYGYRCRHCGSLAFAFTGAEKPVAGDFIENYEISQRGQFASARKSKLGCQNCAAPVSAAGGRMDSACVVEIEQLIEDLNVRNRTQLARATGARNVRHVQTATVTREGIGAGLRPGEKDHSAGLPEKGAPEADAPARPKGWVDPDLKPASELTDEELRYRAKRLKLPVDGMTYGDLLVAVEEAELESAGG